MTKFSFICPVCSIGVNGRNYRRHMRRVHGHDAPRGVERNARRCLKARRRDPRNWERARVWYTATSDTSGSVEAVRW